MAFLIGNQTAFIASSAAVLQVPLQAPVMIRELANKMYNPTVYYFARFTSNLILQVVCAMTMLSCIFYFIGIHTSLDNFLYMSCYACLGAFVFFAQGFFLGIACPNEDDALLLNGMAMMVVCMYNGGFSNLSTANWLVSILSKVDPARYLNEGFFRTCSI